MSVIRATEVRPNEWVITYERSGLTWGLVFYGNVAQINFGSIRAEFARAILRWRASKRRTLAPIRSFSSPKAPPTRK